MTRDFELGKWITGKYKTRAAFAKKLGVDPTRLSRWMNLSDGISEDYQQKIRDLKYDGPWPAEEAAKESQRLSVDGPYVTEKDFAEWRGYWRAGTERLAEELAETKKALADLARRVDQLEGSK